jgi:hypothetical protein
MKFSRPPFLVLAFALSASVPFLGAAAAQERSVIEGRVVDKDTRDPLPAFVMMAGGVGVSAGGDGRFRLAVPTGRGEPVHLIVYLVGYKKKELSARPGVPLTIELEIEPLDAREVTVSADGLVADAKNPRTIGLNKMDIYRIPGAAADPLYASHVLPGVNSLPDSSGLLIRGGAEDEVGYYFDGIEISHPFLSETMHESYFSIFDNQIIDGFAISTSGHPKYGDALSGIMALTAKDAAASPEAGLGLSIMGLTGYVGQPIKGVGSFVGSYSRGWSDVLTWMNGEGGRAFQTAQAFGKFVLTLSPSQQLRIYGLRDDYRYEQTDAFRTTSANTMAGLSWTASWNKAFVTRVILAGTAYEAGYDPSASWRVDQADRALQFRTEASWDLERHYLEFGGDLVGRRVSGELTGPTAYSWRTDGTRAGFYFNDRFRLSDKIYVTAGGRVSSLNLGASRTSFDPRFSVAFLASKTDTLRFSAGFYHQFGEFTTLARNPGLGPKEAVHAALSYDKVREDLELRATLYDKEYQGLFAGPSDILLTNSGRGYARGAEIFVKLKDQSWELIGVYNFLASRRLENDVLDLAPSPYEIRHSGTAILSRKFKNGSLSLRLSAATGRPYTPLLDRVWDASDAAYAPVWGPAMSARYPSYSRIDLSGTKSLTVLKKMVVLYFGVTNLLDKRNTIRYDYASDFSGRLDQQSIFGRTLFLGIYVAL